MNAQIITFYSYKGGCGRSMALANVAWILASNGRRVLVIDWDLEAPGVHRYFRPFLRDPDLSQSPGLIDYFIDVATEAATGGRATGKTLLHHASSLEWEFSGGGTVDLVGAGRQDSSYGLRVNGFSWQSFYERLGGYDLLDRMKQDFAAYDFVLIDSRSGVGDYAGICTVTMPDALVTCFTLNAQSLEGSVAVAQSVVALRSERPLAIFPVPMRVEYGEKELLERARTAARISCYPLLRHIPDTDYWGRVEFPYVPFYAYNEMLAAFADSPFSTASILTAAENLTGYLTLGAVTRTGDLPDDLRKAVRAAYASNWAAAAESDPVKAR
jgi:cellulose biosynthesis protein BcsQ